MQLNSENVARFIGGQAEIQNSVEGYLYRGEIEEISVEGGSLKIEFAWLALGEGKPPERWVKAPQRTYAVGLVMCTVRNIGPTGGDVGGSDRIMVHAAPTSETMVLYPPNGSRLDPSVIEEP